MIRKHYRGYLKESDNYDVNNLISDKEKGVIAEIINAGRCQTLAVYKHERMIFLYYEAIDESLSPKELFPEFSNKLELWTGKNEVREWAQMTHIYYHSELKDPKDWKRIGEKRRRGRIAILKQEKIASYIYYHKAIVDEGLFEGDKYQSIAWHEDVLFSYFEEPKCFTHIKNEVMGKSKVIDEWMRVDPESHFDHDFSGEENFLFIDELFSIG